jgi:hypothetical protein
LAFHKDIEKPSVWLGQGAEFSHCLRITIALTSLFLLRLFSIGAPSCYGDRLKKTNNSRSARASSRDIQKLTTAEVVKAVGVSALGCLLDQPAGTLSFRRNGFIAALVASSTISISDTARGRLADARYSRMTAEI